jgi:hypothetical protein
VDARRERLAKNEAIFREVNERVGEVASSFDIGGRGDYYVDFVCECADATCFEQVSLTLAEYREIRASPIRFALRNGHVDEEVDRVVAENDRFTTVEKKGEAAERAAELDPRT